MLLPLQREAPPTVVGGTTLRGQPLWRRCARDGPVCLPLECLASLQVSAVQCSAGVDRAPRTHHLRSRFSLLCDGAMAPDTLRTVRAAVLAADKVARLVYSTDVVTASVAARIDEAVGELYHTWITVWGARDGVDHAASRPRQGSGSSGASGSSGKYPASTCTHSRPGAAKGIRSSKVCDHHGRVRAARAVHLTSTRLSVTPGSHAVRCQ